MRKVDQLPSVARGIAYMLLSTVAFAILWVLIRIASERLDILLVVFYRTFFGLLFMAPMLWRRRPDVFRTRRPGLQLVRAGTGVLAMYANFFAIAMAPLADVVAISYATPLFATLGAVIFLGEAIRARRVSALVFGILGMLLVIRPGFETLSEGELWALAGAVFMAGSVTAIKLLAREDAAETIVAYSYILTLPVNLLLALPRWQWPEAADFVLLAAIGILANIGQMMLTRAFAATEVTAVLPFDFLRLVLAAAFGAMLFGETLAWQTVAGALVILLSAVYLAHREAQLGRRVAATAPPPGP
ncbi:MAG: DMT family transporter [Rhodothalassiaceae bacterium]